MPQEIMKKTMTLMDLTLMKVDFTIQDQTAFGTVSTMNLFISFQFRQNMIMILEAHNIIGYKVI